MIVFYGWGSDVKKTKYAMRFVCPHCNREAEQNVYVRFNYFSLFFARIVKWEKKYHIGCSYCGGTSDITKDDYKRIKNAAKNHTRPEITLPTYGENPEIRPDAPSDNEKKPINAPAGQENGSDDRLTETAKTAQAQISPAAEQTADEQRIPEIRQSSGNGNEDRSEHAAEERRIERPCADKRSAAGKALWITGGLLLAAGAAMIIAFAAIATESDNPIYGLLGGGIALAVLGLIAMTTGGIVTSVPGAGVKRCIAEYTALPVNTDINYAAAIARVRENFAADANPDKNVFTPKRRLIGTGNCYDFGMIARGGIYYAYLVNALFPMNFKYSMFNPALPAYFVYSQDPYYDSHPLELQRIARVMQDNSRIEEIRRTDEFFNNLLVPPELTGGRTVFVTTIVVYKAHLPLFRITDSLCPVIADPSSSPSAFIVDCRYWPNDLAANYAHAVAANSEEKINVFDV